MDRFKLSNKILQSGCFILLAAVFITVPLYYYVCRYSQVLKNAEKELVQEKQKLNHCVERSFDDTIALVSRTLTLVTQGVEIQNYIEDPNQKNKESLQALWRFIASNQQIYNKISYIDNSGIEKVEVNYDTGRHVILDGETLTDQSQRDYFILAKSLKENEKLAHTMGLEMENGAYTLPYKSVFYIAMPVMKDNICHGYLVIHLDISNYFYRLAKEKPEIYDLEVLDANGFYMLTKDGKKRFGQYLADRRDFYLKKENPQFWQEIQSKKSGLYRDNNHLYIFNNIVFPIDNKSFSFIEYSSVDLDLIKEKHQSELSGILFKAVLTFLSVSCIFIFLGFYVAKKQHRHIRNQLVYAAMRGISAVVVTDRFNNIIKVNEQFTRITGYSESDVLGKNPNVFSSDVRSFEFCQELHNILVTKGEWEGELTSRHKDGQIITELARIKTIKEGARITNYIASFVDITERKNLEDKLRQLSEKDALTKLWNRRVFQERLAFQSKEIVRYPDAHFCSLAILDIDFFKKVNDTYGHQKGDEVIRQVADILSTDSREVDTVARVGGEEFAMIIPHTHLEEARVLLNRKREKIREMSDIDVTISAGVVELSQNVLNDKAYKAADDALYRAKEGGRNRVCS